MRLELSRNITGTITFSPIERELTIPCYSLNNEDILDIEISFYSIPICQELNGDISLQSGEDFRFYVNGINISESIVEQLKDQLKVIPEVLLNKNYLHGVRTFEKWAKNLGLAVKDQKKYAEKYVDEINWHDKISKLGDSSIGLGGSLHPISFFYKYLKFQPVSILKAWNENVDSKDMKSPPKFLNLSMSLGPAPSFEKVNKSLSGGGKLFYSVEILTDNFQNKNSQDILNRLKRINLEMERIKLNYLQKIESDIENIKLDFDNNTNAVRAQLERLKETVENIAG